MISINSGIMTDIFPCKGQRPIATRLPNNEILLCRDSTARSSGRTNLRKNGELTLQFSLFVCERRRERHRGLRRQTAAEPRRDVVRAARAALYATPDAHTRRTAGSRRLTRTRPPHVFVRVASLLLSVLGRAAAAGHRSAHAGHPGHRADDPAGAPDAAHRGRRRLRGHTERRVAATHAAADQPGGPARGGETVRGGAQPAGSDQGHAAHPEGARPGGETVAPKRQVFTLFVLLSWHGACRHRTKSSLPFGGCTPTTSSSARCTSGLCRSSKRSTPTQPRS